ncbi:MAG: hypothetical protein JWO32_433, partial [Bacteroidetes bacterium]|nr:hypothetical protein [Bacteroidota bacterium]
MHWLKTNVILQRETITTVFESHRADPVRSLAKNNE